MADERWAIIASDQAGEFVGAPYKSKESAEGAARALVRQGFIKAGKWRVVPMMPGMEANG